MPNHNLRQQRRQTLLITSVAMALVYVLWNTPALDFLTYPLRLFVTYIHEAGHAFAAIISGGDVVGFLVSPNGSGLAVTRGGSRALTLPAGYLGAALFGSMLFYVANRFPRFINPIAILLGVAIALFTIAFARPDESGAPVALVVGLVFGAVLALIGWRANRVITLLVVNVLGMMTALNAVLDVWYLTQFADASRGAVRNDAAAFSAEITPLIPAAVIAFIWAAASVFLLGLAVWYGVWKPLRSELGETVDGLLK